MAKQHSPQKATQPAKSERQVDKLFAQYAAFHQNGTNKLLQRIFVPIFFFGLFGLAWAIPFPHIGFLGKYNGFINWASFLIAFSIYYYYKLSPVLSYFILFTLFGFSYFIIKLEQWEHAGGGRLWQVSVVFLVIGLAGMLLGYGTEKNKPGFAQKLQHIIISPIYLWHLLLNKMSVKF